MKRHGTPRLAALLVACAACLLASAAEPTDGWPSLVDQDGRPFSFEELRGHPVVLNFVFTHCPAICPAQVQTLATIRRDLPAEVRTRVRFVSVTVDPERDTPEVLKGFARSLDVEGSDWSFVTGSAADLTSLQDRYGVRIVADGAAQINHRIAVYLLDAGGRLVQTYTGEPLDHARLVREIQAVDRLFRTEP